jgi:AcrR family transcriptional regulator
MVSDPRSARRRSRAARAGEERADRRAALLGAAREMFRGAAPDAIAVSDIAARAGVAKGTVYLYFATKEEIFLAIASEEIDAWLDALDARLDRGARGAAGVGRALRETLSRRADLLRLLSLLHSVLERNVTDAAVLAFKRALQARLAATGARLERALPFLGAGEGARLLLRVHALVVGLSQVTTPAPAVARALEDPALRGLRLELLTELGETLGALLAGLEVTKGRKRR